MPRPFEVSLGPPFQGLNDFTDPRELPMDFLTQADYVDLSRGGVKGAWTPAIISPVEPSFSSTPPYFIYNTNGVNWIGDSAFLAEGITNWACLQSSGSGASAISYVTKIPVGGGTINNPVAIFGATPYQLGIPAPASVVVTSGSSGGARYYSITQIDIASGNESNPTYIGTTTKNNGANFTLPSPTSGTLGTAFNIYGSNTDDANGIKSPRYWLAQKGSGATFSDPGTNGDSTSPLDWGIGGYYTTPTLNQDHSPAPALSCLSDGLHGATADTKNPLGMLFGASLKDVYWSIVNRPFYWSTAFNTYSLPQTVLAMVSRGAQTFAFTEGGIWSFSGTSDTAIQGNKTQAHLGVLRNAGKTVCQSPYGILYVSREGVTLFDGFRSNVISRRVIDPLDFIGATTISGAYYDGYYVVAVLTSQSGYNGSTWMLDVRELPSITVSKAPLPIVSMTVLQQFSAATGLNPPGLYVAHAEPGQPFAISAWRPAEGGSVTGAIRAGWTLETANSDLGYPGKFKRLQRARIQVTGSAGATFVFTADDGNGGHKTFTVNATAAQQIYRFPAGFDGIWHQYQATALAGDTQLHAVSLGGEVMDAA